MKFFFHYSPENFANTYLLGPEGGGDAILIDPGTLEIPFFKIIEENDFYIRNIFVTSNDSSHLRGLRTIKKIYDAQVWSREGRILDFECNSINPGMKIPLPLATVEAWAFPEYHSDALAYRINNWLFCGDILRAGRPGRTRNPETRFRLLEALEKRLYSLQDDLVIFPGEGPPTTIKSEKLFNLRFR